MELNTVYLALIGAVLAISLFTSRTFSFRFGRGRAVTIGGKKEPAARCDECKAITIREARELAESIAQKKSELIFRQLKYAENALGQIFPMLCTDYAESLLCGNVQGEPKDSPYYDVYCGRVDKFIRCIVIAGLRQVYQENHIAEKTPKEWDDHKRHVIQAIRADMLRYIDAEFTPVGGMTRADVERFHADRWKVFEKLINDSMDKAREFAQAVHSELTI